MRRRCGQWPSIAADGGDAETMKHSLRDHHCLSFYLCHPTSLAQQLSSRPCLPLSLSLSPLLSLPLCPVDVVPVPLFCPQSLVTFAWNLRVQSRLKKKNPTTTLAQAPTRPVRPDSREANQVKFSTWLGCFLCNSWYSSRRLASPRLALPPCRLPLLGLPTFRQQTPVLSSTDRRYASYPLAFPIPLSFLLYIALEVLV